MSSNLVADVAGFREFGMMPIDVLEGKFQSSLAAQPGK
jgi:hypothetical protein